jgi:hypothetical protein
LLVHDCTRFGIRFRVRLFYTIESHCLFPLAEWKVLWNNNTFPYRNDATKDAATLSRRGSADQLNRSVGI